MVIETAVRGGATYCSSFVSADTPQVPATLPRDARSAAGVSRPTFIAALPVAPGSRIRSAANRRRTRRSSRG
jgi:hypothetical protein